MRISSLEITNYRSIEDLKLNFTSCYTAISGKNDSGKSNVIKSMKSVFKIDNFLNHDDFLFKENFPAWKLKSNTNENIVISITMIIKKNDDSGIYKFIETFAKDKVKDNEDKLNLKLICVYNDKDKEPEVDVFIGSDMCERFAAQEIFKKIQSSRVIIICNLADPEGRFFLRKQSAVSSISAISSQEKEKLDKKNADINKTLNKLAKKHQKDIEKLFGRLSEEYNVGLSVQKLNLNNFPFNITLGDKHINVPLDDWGCGTRNKTAILLAFLRIKQIKDSDDISKITPIILLEEPESFLHPSAQAMFGKLLQELSEQHEVQIITTTHSPYFLSQKNPNSNVLLDRKFEGNKIRQTILIPTSNKDWMEPYALSLGIINKEFEPWKDLIFNKSSKILMVEGKIDAEYFELLKNPSHEKNALKSDIEIYAYTGKDNLNNQVFLKFIKNRHRKMFITFDLDAKSSVSKTLQSLGFKETVDYMPIGKEEEGEQNIEGLLPTSIKSAVVANNTKLISKLASVYNSVRNSAKQELKNKYLEEFKSKAVPGNEFYSGFYKLTRVINKAFNNVLDN